jgi:hypothetical protein
MAADKPEGSELDIQYFSTREGVENYYGEYRVQPSPRHTVVLHGSLRSSYSQYGVKKLKEYLNSAKVTLDRLVPELTQACHDGKLDFNDRIAFTREKGELAIKLEITLEFDGEPNRQELDAGYWSSQLELVAAMPLSPIGLSYYWPAHRFPRR